MRRRSLSARRGSNRRAEEGGGGGGGRRTAAPRNGRAAAAAATEESRDEGVVVGRIATGSSSARRDMSGAAAGRAPILPRLVSPALLLMLLLLLLLQRGLGCAAVSVVDHRTEDEEVLEHQVEYEEALKEARNVGLYPGAIVGCKPCTSNEMNYCKNGSVLEDHCCCDNGYNEVLGFVQHTCRLGPEACQVRAGDCSEYTRLRECCCHFYLASLWKYWAGGASVPSTSYSLLVFTFLVALYGAVR